MLRAFHAGGLDTNVGSDGDVNLYHLGNNELHAAIYGHALRTPGVALLHDALLQHLFLRTLSEREYVDEFVFNYGGWHQDLARDLYQRPSGLRPELYRYPMLKRIAETSVALVVHNQVAGDLVSRHAPSAMVHVIPHIAEQPPQCSPVDALDFREAHGIPACAWLFGLFGYLRESKRVISVLRAFRDVHAAIPNTRLLVAGDFVSPDLPVAAEPWLAQPGVVRRGHLSEAEFWTAASATDTCVNLRDPACGETSGIAIRFMSLGKAVVVSAVPENAEFPDSCCFRVDTGIAEVPMLTQAMMLAARFPEMSWELGRNAARHIAARHSPESVTAQFRQLFEENLPASRQRNHHLQRA